MGAVLGIMIGGWSTREWRKK